MIISLFGRGFIGGRFHEMYKDEVFVEERDSLIPKYNNILYLISTTHNYNIYSDINIDIDTNLKKLVAILENCKNRKNLVFNFISSWFVYGDIKMPFKETDLCNPKGFYSITKKTAEDLLISFCTTFSLQWKIFRLANVFGPGDKGVSKQKNALTYLANKIKKNEDVDLYWGGDFYRDYFYVDDTCEVIKFLIDNAPNNSIYNIGSGNAIKFLDLMNYIKLKTNSKSKFNSIEPPSFHKNVQIRNAFLNISKLETLGYKNKFNIWDKLDTII